MIPGIWKRVAEKRHEETFGGDENILYFDYDGGYMPVYICQSSSNCTLEQ